MQRRSVVAVLVRLLLSCAALTLLRFGQTAWHEWQVRVNDSFDPGAEWGRWGTAMALLLGAGIVLGLAALAGRPTGYRWSVPLALTLPALLMLGHYVLLVESVGESSTELPWILDHVFFYMEAPSQFVVAVVAGFGIGAGWRTGGGRPAERDPGTPDGSRDSAASVDS